MSFDLVHAVFSITSLSGPDKATLLALCDHAHNDGTGSYASVHLLAGEASLGERTVQRSLKSLEAQGFIATEGLPADWRERTQEEFIAGGRQKQTVSYRILLPNADMVEAAKHRAKAPAAPDYEGPTGAPQAPLSTNNDGCPTGTPIEDGCPTGTRGVPQRHPTGAPQAPKEVREAVREPATTTGAAEALSKGAGKATPKADKIIAWFMQTEHQAMPASKRQKAELEQMLKDVPDSIGRKAIARWHKERDFTGLRFPAQALLSELPAYLKLFENEARANVRAIAASRPKK